METARAAGDRGCGCGEGWHPVSWGCGSFAALVLLCEEQGWSLGERAPEGRGCLFRDISIVWLPCPCPALEGNSRGARAKGRSPRVEGLGEEK